MESSEWMTAGEAANRLGVSKARMAKMIANNEIRWQHGRLDKRVKLVWRADVESMAAEPRGGKRDTKEAA